MPESHERWLGLLALDAAGMLTGADKADFDEHVVSCLICRAERKDLDAVVTALARAELDVTPDGAPTPPARLGDRVVWAVAKARRSDRLQRRFAAGIAAAAACLAFFAAGVALPDPPGAPQEPLTLVMAPGVAAEASLVAHTWGTEVKLVMEGLDQAQRYEVTVFDAAGRAVPAGTLLGDEDRPVVCAMNAAVLREDARRVEVASAGGEVVIVADLPVVDGAR